MAEITQLPKQWVNRPGREADTLPPSRTEIKNTWSYTFIPQYVFMAWHLVKSRDNFALFRKFVLCKIN
jgi:hypothetical protein